MPSQASSPSAPTGGPTVPIEMPRLSSEEGTATLSAWLVSVGDAVEKGALIAELETDKATVELEAPVEGRIESLVVSVGTEGLKPGTLLGRIEPTAAVAGGEASPGAAPSSPTPAGVTAAPSILEPALRSPATPLARRVAEARGIDLERVTGTGLGGRIEKADVERTASTPTPAARAAKREATSDSRRERASELAAPARASEPSVRPALAQARPVAPIALSTGSLEAPRPPAHLSLRCSMDAIVAARARLNENPSAGRHEARITVNDFIVRAAALALRDVPAANRRRAGDSVEGADAVDITLVAGTDAGPVPLTLRDADRKGLAVLAAEIRAAVEKARAGEVPGEHGAPGTLTITSFARFGIESAFPMLPSDQVCLLAVGTVREEPVVRDGALAVGSTVSLSLAFDPTAIGGSVAAELLGAIRGHLEDPLGMML